MKMIDQAGNAIEIPDEQAGEAFRSGQYGFEHGAKIPVVDELGTVGTIDAAHASEAFAQPELETVSQSTLRKAEREAKYGGVGGQAAAFGIGAGDALTLGFGKGLAVEGAGLVGGRGAADSTREAITGYTETNPHSELAGQIVGTAAPLVFGGVQGLAGKGIRGVGAGVRAVEGLGGAAERGIAGIIGEGGGVLGRAARLGGRAATEGAVYGAGGAFSDAVVKNEDLTVEKLLAGMGESAATAGVLGAGIGGAVAVAETAIRKAANATIGKLTKASETINETLRKASKVAGEVEGAAAKVDEIGARAAGEEAAAGKAATAESRAAAVEEHIAPAESKATLITDDVSGAAKYAPDALDDKAFPRRTRYARGARDVLDPEFGDTDLPLGGRPGGDTEIEELRRALVAEDINSQHRVAKVDRLMQVVPEGAHPDWVMGMTKAQRASMADFVGVPDASDVTWRALADAVADREGVKGWKPPGSAPASNVVNLPVAEEARPAAAAAASPGAQAPAAAMSGTTAEAPAIAKAGTPEHDVWRDIVGRISDWAVRKGAGKAMGALIGSSHGPVGYLAGKAVGAAVDRVLTKHLDAVSTKITSSIDDFFAKGSTGKGAPAVQAKPAEVLSRGARAASVLFGGEHEHAPPKTLDARYEQASEAVAHMASNPATSHAIAERVVAPLARSNPGVAAKIASKQTIAIKYLSSKLPPSMIQAPLSAAHMKSVSDMDKASFMRTLKAVQRPLSVLEDMKNGDLSKEGVDALKNVNPEMYQDVRSKVLDKVAALDAEGKSLSYEQKLQVGVLFDAAVDPTQAPAFVAAVQSLYAEMGNAQSPDAGGQPPGGAPKNKVDTAGAHETMTQKLEGRDS